MQQENSTDQFFKSTVLGHPSGLFVLFFTEMWERFSFYGMRALLVLFFTASILDQGWGWQKDHAMAIFGSYVGLLYLSTMLGGYFADKIIGYRYAVVIGALLMTLGHGAMAIETTFSIYTGLVLLVFGNGFFKPNMTSIVSEIYKDRPDKKDGAYTIFYMGVNSGAFFGIMLCGYLGEKIGWSWGFGVAGIFMFFGLIQFWLSQKIFGDIGLKPVKKSEADTATSILEENGGKLNPFSTFELILIALSTFLGITWILNAPMAKVTEGAYNLYDFILNGKIAFLTEIIGIGLLLWMVKIYYKSLKEIKNEETKDKYGKYTFAFVISFFVGVILFNIKAVLNFLYEIFNHFNFLLFSDEASIDGSTFIILLGFYIFVFLLLSRVTKYIPVVRDRMLAIIFFAFITMFFWSIFEQTPGSLNLFARDYTQRILEGTAGSIFKVVDALITIVPLAIITWVLLLLYKQTFKKYALANIILALSFIIVWGIALWKVNNDYNSSSYVIEYLNNNGGVETTKIVTSDPFNNGDKISIIDNESISLYDAKADTNKDKVIKDNILFNKNNEKLSEIFSGKVSNIFKEEKIGAGIQVSKAEITFTNSKSETKSKVIKLSKEDLEKLKVGSDVAITVEHKVGYDNKQTNKNQATVKAKESAVEIPATWFQILNSLFIITLAPLFSKWWESKYNPNASGKYAIGMLMLAIGSAFIAIGAMDIEVGAKSASVSIIWLILLYLFFTMAELCVSPVALSYVSKLVPARMIGIMFGIWYLAVAIGMKMAGMFGEVSESIAEEKGISTFFWYLTGISLALSVLAYLTTPIFRKLMHGVK